MVAEVDKFFGTDQDAILKDEGVDTVIVCGTTASRSVSFTATGVAMQGYKVVLAVD